MKQTINKNSKAVNKFEVRIWSKEHYGINKEKFSTKYSGLITDINSRERIMFHSAGQLLLAIEKLNKKAEKARRAELVQ